jgi:type IV pilus assembly protein PilW
MSFAYVSAMAGPVGLKRVQRGFTLIELMIGLLLGLLSVLVITQVMATSEGKRRTTSMGGDAQTNGAMALYTLQRDLQMAGYGLTSSLDALGCEVRAQYGTAVSYTFPLAPVVIDDGGTGPDTVTVLRAQSAGFSLPLVIDGSHSMTDDSFVVRSGFGAAVDNMMIAVPKLQGAGTWCTLFQVAEDKSSPTTKLEFTIVPHVLAGASGGSLWNQPGMFPSSYVKDDYLLNMHTLIRRAYSIFAVDQAYSLRATDLGASAQDLYPQIVNLKALYGTGVLDAAGNVIVDMYTNKPRTTNAQWQGVVAIRVAIVARSAKYEKEVVTPIMPQWDVGPKLDVAGTPATCNGTNKCITLTVPKLDSGMGDGSEEEWKHYRYKVYETIVPVRNVLWNS